MLCALQYSKETGLEVSPQVKAETEIIRFFFPSAICKCLVCYFSSGVHCSFHTLQSPLSSLSTFHSISVHFLQLHFPVFIFLSHRFPLIFQNTLVYLGFFPFYNHRVLPSLSLPTLGTLPGQPGTGALGDPSIFQGEEVTLSW